MTATNSHDIKLKNIAISTEYSPFTEIKYFNERMKQFYLEGNFPSELNRYFDWKFGKINVSSIALSAAYDMRDTCREILDTLYDKHPEAFRNVEFYHFDSSNYDIEESLWCHFKGFQEDKYMVSFLEAIESNLCELIMSGLLKS